VIDSLGAVLFLKGFYKAKARDSKIVSQIMGTEERLEKTPLKTEEIPELLKNCLKLELPGCCCVY
jgi:hypothetical protein